LEAMLQSMILKRAGAPTTGRDKPVMPAASTISEPTHETDKTSTRGALIRQTGLHPREPTPRPDQSQTQPDSTDTVPLKVTSQPPTLIGPDQGDAGEFFLKTSGRSRWLLKSW